MTLPVQPIASQGYLSIDLETTGLDPSYCQILEIGAVWDDWQSKIEDLPRFHCYVVHEQVVGEYFALSMPSNQKILERIAKRYAPENREYSFFTPAQAMQELVAFTIARRYDAIKYGDTFPKLITAGKNFASFDDRFLMTLPGYKDLQRHHRCVDPGMRFWDPRIDKVPPDTKTCLQRAGILTEVAHDAISDALDVIRLVRNSVNLSVPPV